MENVLIVWAFGILAYSVIFGVITMFIARSRGRGMIRWFIVGFFLSWVGVIIVLCAGRTAAAQAKHNIKVADGMTDALFKAAKGGTAFEVKAALAAGADPGARDRRGKLPFDYAKDNEALKGTEAYRLLNEGRFE